MEDWLRANQQMITSVVLAAAALFALRLVPRILAGVPFVTPKDLKARMDADADILVLDVRSTGEYAGGHVPSALNLPLDQLSGRLDSVRQDLGDYMDTPIYVYCQTSNRAASAARSLKKAGLRQVRVMTGGMNRWRNEGLPRSQDR